LIDRRKIKHPKHHVADEQIPGELSRLEAAVAVASSSLIALKDKAGEHSSILEAHLMMMQDPLLLENARRHIVDDKCCAEWALRSAVSEIRSSFEALGDEYFRERRSDIDFVGDRILSAMLNAEGNEVSLLDAAPADAIVVSHDLSPADVIALSKKRVRGIVTEVGGSTSHTAILARARDLPAVVGCASVIERAGAGDPIIVDGGAGEVVLDPTPDLVARYKGLSSRRAQVFGELQRQSKLDSTSLDGRKMALLANIEIPEEIARALAAGAEGVGLYRSEFLFINRRELPSHLDHETVCGAILDGLGDMPATLRTFDIGSDKLAAAVRLPREHNPALGLRACRLGLARPTMFRAQLRGMLKAIFARKRGSILLPMIGSVDELTAVRALIDGEVEALGNDGIPRWEGLRVGVMIELPAAVWIADELAARCDFFSVGTNDLIQHALGIDRGNEQVAHLYQPLHPAVLRALKVTVDAAHRKKIPVSLCGESAADPALLPALLGLGFDSLSMPASAIPRVRYVLRRLRFDDCQRLVAACLACARARDVEALVNDALEGAVPDLAMLREAAHE
jgi:phosphotransferase system enzyme I (PtsI)